MISNQLLSSLLQEIDRRRIGSGVGFGSKGVSGLDRTFCKTTIEITSSHVTVFRQRSMTGTVLFSKVMCEPGSKFSILKMKSENEYIPGYFYLLFHR